MNKLQANICLLAATLCWSCEVVIIAAVPEGIDPFGFMCLTACVGAVLLCACFFKRVVYTIRSEGGVILRRILLLAVLNTSYNVLYHFGLDYFDVSAGAFGLSLTAVVLPVMLIVMRRGVDERTWMSAGFVLAGIVVAVLPTVGSQHSMGVLVLFIGCIVRAVFIVKLNDYARTYDPMTLAAGTAVCNAVISFVPWVFTQPGTFFAVSYNPRLIATVFIYSYFIVAFATVVNTYAQRRASAVHSTIIYSTEIVFAVIWACVLPDFVVIHVQPSVAIVVGCVLIIAGNLIKIAPISGRAPVGSEDSDGGGEDGAIAVREHHPTTLQMAAFMERLRSPDVPKIALFAALLAVYLIISLPFKVLLVIPGFADIRPVCMLQPVYGIFFGIPGCLAFAVGNLISDIASDSLRWSSIAGFVANFLYPYMMYLFFTKLRREPFSLRDRKSVALFAAALVVCACVECLVITPAVGYYYPDVDLWLFAVAVLGNCTLFSLGFAIPFIVLIQEELGFSPLHTPRKSKRVTT